MKVVLGADAIRHPLTGVGRYAYELARRLLRADGIGQVRYFRAGRVVDALPARPVEDVAGQAGLRLRALAGRVPLLAEAFRRVAGAVQERALRPYRDHVFHGPSFHLPAHGGPSVVTIHDLSVFLWPECHPGARVAYLRKQLPLALKRADVLLTDSDFTRREVAGYFNWPLARIVVAPLAADAAYRPHTAAESAPALARLGLRHGFYSLFVGTLDPRKNIDLLLGLYERLPAALARRAPLVVAGFEGWKSEATIARLRAGERAGWARYLGFVDEAALPALYAGARVFLYPSRYEGFGLPLLEAMACGVPVIGADAASLPEVAGAAGALLLGADDEAAFYQALLRALEDDAWCQAAGAAGLARAAQFSWDKTVAATVGAYRLAVR
jgi:alpha-1,3-rhamnosyl/mannosyltransferase